MVAYILIQDEKGIDDDDRAYRPATYGDAKAAATSRKRNFDVNKFRR